MLKNTYPDPVDQLLSFDTGDAKDAPDWPDYVRRLGLTASHVPALIQMSQDEQLWSLFIDNPPPAHIVADQGLDPELAAWAPIHAWRALGQLQATEAIEPLTEVLAKYDMDWCWEELPQVYALMGADAIEPLTTRLESDKFNDETKLFLADGLKGIGKQHPDLRDRSIAALTQALSHYKQNDPALNGSIVANLIDLKAVEAAAVMEEAYGSGRVDEMFAGTWPRVQVDLGLKQKSDFTPEELRSEGNFFGAINRVADKLMGINQPGATALGLSISDTMSSSKPTAKAKDTTANEGADTQASKLGFGSAPKKKKKKR